MRPSSRPHIALLAPLLFAIALVLCADILAVTAAADPLPASTGAVLSPIRPASISRPYSHSSFRVSSRLLDETGQPIPNARVDILQQVNGSSQMKVIGSTLTRADGSLSATIPAGPSRLIDLAYPTSERRGYATQTEMLETVTAGLRLRITPLHTSPTGTVQLEGQVLGVLPAHGVVVEVLVYYLGQWQPIRTPRTGPDGRLRLNYRFHQATGQFPFRLRVRYGQIGFPYGEACSPWVAVAA
jgi:5-hydroxyisourate hydrolase-like protein (transthyretin family)